MRRRLSYPWAAKGGGLARSRVPVLSVGRHAIPTCATTDRVAFGVTRVDAVGSRHGTKPAQNDREQILPTFGLRRHPKSAASVPKSSAPFRFRNKCCEKCCAWPHAKDLHPDHEYDRRQAN